MNQSRESVEKWLDFAKYVSKYRYCSYWHQLDEVYKSGARSILEIGVGSNVTASYLRSQGFDIVTLDVEKGLAPDVAGSVVSLPFKDDAFEAVVCCQVLEHLPYELFGSCLVELHRVCRKKLILSLPDKTIGIYVLLRVPNFIFWHVGMFIPWALREPIRKVKEHYWELGRWGFPKRRIISALATAGFSLDGAYRVPEYPYHHFFIATPCKPAPN